MDRLAACVSFAFAVSCSCASAQHTAGASPTPASIPFPHPVISEILAQVPNTNDVDPSRDNLRDAVGDEFIELVNPHDRSIDLTGYTLADALAIAHPEDERGVRFVFPRFTLGPGEAVVVFNGYRTSVMGAHGNANQAPRERNEKFEDAWVFSMLNATRFRALNNSDEMVVLLDPSGTAIDAVVWGEPDAAVPEGCLRVDHPGRSSGGSLVRAAADGPIEHHAAIGTAAYSPGRPFAGKTEREND
ncbi:MAG: lamin tail domain-containing protein [Phycisphaerales bacterium]